MKKADILLVRSVTHVDAALLTNSAVKFVGSITAGADHLDMKWLAEAGIHFSIAAGFNAPPVADYVVSIIAALRKKGFLPSQKFKAAVVGVGNVGRLMAARLKWLNCEIVLCDPFRAQVEKDFPSVPFEDLADLDFISFHVPLTKTGAFPTYHFINQVFLRKQKPGCILVNASRGGLIHSNDLLQYGGHLKWCFDVWEHEPKINKAILEKACIATPHIAGYSRQSKIRGIDFIYRVACAQNIIAPMTIPAIVMPTQVLHFKEERNSWEDIVLGVFNPIVITQMMRTLLLFAKEHGELFDEMRNQFNYRNEFNYTEIKHVQPAKKDKLFLEKLGFRINGP